MTQMHDITDNGDIQDTIARLLRDAEKGHAEFEQTPGHTQIDWSDWYAEYLVEHLPEQQ